MSRPTSIRIFLVDGTPDGIRVVEKSNWTGRAVVASRTQLSDALRRDEMSRPGVYVLAGSGDEGDSRLYVGEADDLGERLRSLHCRGREPEQGQRPLSRVPASCVRAGGQAVGHREQQQPG